MTVLFISNGHGEDAIATYIIRELRASSPETKILAFPLIGPGEAYRGAGIEVRLPSTVLPHGFSPWSAVAASVRVVLSIPAERSLAAADLTVAVGDAYPLLAALRLKRPCIFAGVNKSEYYRHKGHRYLPWERALIKKAAAAFVRDRKTAEHLRKKGLANVRYAGNPMMDIPPGIPAPRGERTIVLIPGSYEDMALNMADLLRAAAACASTGCGIRRFAMTLPTHVGFDISKGVEAPGWELRDGGWRQGDIRVDLSHDLPGEVAACELVIGLSGTANEQAAGFGRPVIGFPGRGVQYTRAFMSEQHDLLGDALAEAAGPSGAALTAAAILGDRALYDRMSAAGKERMGTADAGGGVASGKGASAAIAHAIVEALAHGAEA